MTFLFILDYGWETQRMAPVLSRDSRSWFRNPVQKWHDRRTELSALFQDLVHFSDYYSDQNFGEALSDCPGDYHTSFGVPLDTF